MKYTVTDGVRLWCLELGWHLPGTSQLAHQGERLADTRMNASVVIIIGVLDGKVRFESFSLGSIYPMYYSADPPDSFSPCSRQSSRPAFIFSHLHVDPRSSLCLVIIKTALIHTFQIYRENFKFGSLSPIVGMRSDELRCSCSS